MKFLWLCIVFTMGILKAQVFPVKGTVKDFENGNPLPYASIQVLNSHLGTYSDDQGRFSLVLDSLNAIIQVSLIGYESGTFKLGKADSLLYVELIPVSYETKTILVPPLTWAEKFITNVIQSNKSRNANLNFYRADAYSKTVFTKPPEQIIGLIESVSEISYLPPDQFQEKLIAAKIPPHIKNLPYRSISINQRLNVNTDFIMLQNLYFISPLGRNALNYYDYSVKDEIFLDDDTLVTIIVKPKTNNTPLFEGELTFSTNKLSLKELRLNGNEQAKTSVLDSIKLIQKYTLFDSLYNLPVFSKCAFEMNCMGMSIWFQQEYTFANYKINNEHQKPVIPSGDRLIEDIKKDIDVDSSRDNYFRAPLSQAEQKHLDFIDSVFVRSSLMRRLLLLSIVQLPSLVLDEPAEIGNFDIRHLSNWYHFNKADGHYIGFEYNGYSNEQSSMFINAGYGFTSRMLTLNLLFNWNQFNLRISNSVTNLGNFPYNKSIQTFETLIKHEDDNIYYISQLLTMEYQLSLKNLLNISPFIQFENQMPIGKIDEFSIFNRDKRYNSNYSIITFRNNSVGVNISFNQNNAEYNSDNALTVNGSSFFNIMTHLSLASKPILNSTENGFSFLLKMHLHEEITRNINSNFSFFFHKQTGALLIQNMNFVSSSLMGTYQNSALSFFTLDNYQFYMQDFLRLRAETDFIKFPALFNFRISLGCIYSFLKSFDTVEIPPFSALKSDFHEFGIAIKGISFLNMYLLKNSISGKRVFFKLNFGL